MLTPVMVSYHLATSANRYAHITSSYTHLAMLVWHMLVTYQFPSAEKANEDGVVCVGANLEPRIVLQAYCVGLFPMPLTPEGLIAWWSPDPRGVLELSDLVVHRSLRRSLKRYKVTVDTAFESVIRACASIDRPHGWIDSQMQKAYIKLHEMGLAHSVEVWKDNEVKDDDTRKDHMQKDGDRWKDNGLTDICATTELVGGLYGVAVGGLFAGESMFHTERDASKVALVHLVERLTDAHDRLIDVQWLTPHLSSLGAKAVPRAYYLERLTHLLKSPQPCMHSTDTISTHISTQR